MDQIKVAPPSPRADVVAHDLDVRSTISTKKPRIDVQGHDASRRSDPIGESARDGSRSRPDLQTPRPRARSRSLDDSPGSRVQEGLDLPKPQKLAVALRVAEDIGLRGGRHARRLPHAAVTDNHRQDLPSVEGPVL